MTRHAGEGRQGGAGSRAVDRRRPEPIWRQETGLTLIELMVVVAIIAVIGAIAMALYQDIVKKSKLAADNATVASLRSAVAIYYGKFDGSFPGGMGVVNSLITPAPVYQCSATPSYDSSNGKIDFSATLADCP
jgi:type IV pilus assembly protein PilA